MQSIEIKLKYEDAIWLVEYLNATALNYKHHVPSVFTVFKGTDAVREECEAVATVGDRMLNIASAIKESTADFVVIPRKVAIIHERILSTDAIRIVTGLECYEDLGADSLDKMEMLLALEDAYGLDISDDDSNKFRAPRDVVNYLSTRGVL
jgi:acyl carrier protein